jgi:chromosome segregation ATPase
MRLVRGLKERLLKRFGPKESGQTPESRLSSLENQLSTLTEAIKTLENRVGNLERKQQPKPEEEVKQLEEALTPPKPQPSLHEAIEDVKKLEMALRPRPLFESVDEAIAALRKSREELEQAQVQLRKAQLLQQLVNEIKENRQKAAEFRKKIEEILAGLKPTLSELDKANQAIAP